MQLLLSNKQIQLLLFLITTISGILSAQKPTSSFSFQYWDSLYTKTLEKSPGSADSIIEQLLYFTETTEDSHGDSYAKYVLANEFYRVNAWDKALEYNEQALAICQNVPNSSKDIECQKIIGGVYFLNAKIHKAKGNFNQAIFHYEHVIELTKDSVDQQNLMSQIGLGEIHLSLGAYLKAYQYFEQARQLVIDNKIGNQMSAWVLAESAELLSEVGLDSLSEKNLQAAEQIALEYTDTILQIKILYLHGCNYFRRNQLDEAEHIYHQALDLAQQKENLNFTAFTQLGLGKIAFERGELEVSLARFNEVFRLSKVLTQKKTLTESQAYIGKINLQRGAIDTALLHCNQSYNISSEASLLRVQLLSCNCLKQIHEQIEDWQTAYVLQEEENVLRVKLSKNLIHHKINSAYFENAMANLIDQQVLERERLESEKSLFNQLASLQYNRLILLSVLLGSSLLSAFVFYRLFKSKKNLSLELQSLNKQLNAGNKMLEQSNGDLNLTNEKLQQTNNALNNFATVAAHDLKGPLRTINSFSHLLKRELGNKITEKEEEYFQYINGSSKNLAVLIDDLLRFSALGKEMDAPTEVDVNTIVDEVKINIKQTITDTSAVVEYSELPNVLANPSLMIQLFQNIISNGLKFVKEGELPKIKIYSSHLGTNRIQFYIQDNGIGISKNHQKKIFELFTRLNSKKEYEGSGVGLATCRRIVQHYGGQIKIDSNEGEGTTLIFDLPAAL